MLQAVKKELEVFNCITFEEKKHRYFIHGKESDRPSVTGVISKYKPKFDEDKWSNIKAKELNISVDEMKFIWREKNLMSTTLGTEFHRFTECAYTKEIYNFNEKNAQTVLGDVSCEILKKKLLTIAKQFIVFYNENSKVLQCVGNEVVIGDFNDSRVCGTLDMLAYNTAEKCFEIVDFKTNKNITYLSKYKETYLPPLQRLQVCEFNTYSLQLSIYKYIIEKYTSLKVQNLKIVWFNAEEPSYQIIKCEDLTSYVKQILSN